MERESERLLSQSLASLTKGKQRIFAHIGLWIAVLSLLAAALVTFTDISLLSVSAEDMTLRLGVYAAVTVVIFLSLAQEGEHTARTEGSFKDAERIYLAAEARIRPEHYGALDEFCRRYTEKELLQRRKRLLLTYKKTEEDASLPFALRKKLARLRPLPIHAAMLLGRDTEGAGAPLWQPARRRRHRFIAKLTPSLFCMSIGIGIAIGAREPLSTSAVLEGLFKLSALTIIGLRGYMQGYLLVEEAEVPFIRAKARLLEQFLCEQDMGENISDS